MSSLDDGLNAGCGCFYLAWLMFNVALLIGVVWAAIHFIAKFW